jgi:hypothetical protein
MATTFGRSSSHHGPDVVTEELIAVLSSRIPLEFKSLFDLVHANLKERNLVHGGEEMLRLRSYEKLQNLVNRGWVTKTVTKTTKKYQGLASLAANMAPAILQHGKT